jgi:hypothetical protein
LNPFALGDGNGRPAFMLQTNQQWSQTPAPAKGDIRWYRKKTWFRRSDEDTLSREQEEALL